MPVPISEDRSESRPVREDYSEFGVLFVAGFGEQRH